MGTWKGSNLRSLESELAIGAAMSLLAMRTVGLRVEGGT